MAIKPISAKRMLDLYKKSGKSKGSDYWSSSSSLKTAKEKAGRKQVYRTGSGTYVWRK